MSGKFDDLESINSAVIDCAYAIHSDVGPGMLESAYEAFLAHALTERGYAVERQKALPLSYRGVTLEAGFRVD
jgi:GxxExxY protein